MVAVATAAPALAASPSAVMTFNNVTVNYGDNVGGVETSIHGNLSLRNTTGTATTSPIVVTVTLTPSTVFTNGAATIFQSSPGWVVTSSSPGVYLFTYAGGLGAYASTTTLWFNLPLAPGHSGTKVTAVALASASGAGFTPGNNTDSTTIA